MIDEQIEEKETTKGKATILLKNIKKELKKLKKDLLSDNK
tara:strand:- start:59 stop:178 length:120 start_codon:yes stop_codon:yes gene_type:complete